MVSKFPAEIAAAAKATGVDANLIRAIMCMETTHGYYDVVIDNPVVDWIDDINIKHKSIKNKSILPMNMNVDFWGDAFGSRADMHDPMKNIMAGANLLKRIKACMSSSADIARIAAVYNNLGAQKISDHGARVKCIYHKKSWIL